MDKHDLVLLNLYARVRGHREPEDHPASSSDIAQDCHLALEQTLSLCKTLSEGFIAISPLHTPPLVYITLTGLARVRRMDLSQKVSSSSKRS